MASDTPTATVMPAELALPVVSSTNHEIASSVDWLPIWEMRFATSSA